MIYFDVKQMILQAVFDKSVTLDDFASILYKFDVLMIWPEVLVGHADDEALVILEGKQ